MTHASPHVVEAARVDVSTRADFPLTFDSEEQRIASFAHAIDTIKKDVEADLGARDLAHIQRVAKLSQRMEWLGRGLVHFSVEPVAFALGVSALWMHKTLELTEIGHSVLHGTYDHLPGAEAYRAERFHWKAPIDEESWRAAHNIRHHQYTNIIGRDPDLDFGVLRLSPRVSHRGVHRLQPLSNLLTWTVFAAAINVHSTGLIDVYARRDPPHVLPDRSWKSIGKAHANAFRKFIPYYAREYLGFPLLAGPFFWKTLLGNGMSELGRDLYAAATVYCGHVGASDYPADARPMGRARWYVMQVEGARNFEVPTWISILCGALDRQIEHHLFPRLPPNRLREIAPAVRAACDAHGVRYRTDTWWRTLRDVFKSLRTLATPLSAP